MIMIIIIIIIFNTFSDIFLLPTKFTMKYIGKSNLWILWNACTMLNRDVP